MLRHLQKLNISLRSNKAHVYKMTYRLVKIEYAINIDSFFFVYIKNFHWDVINVPNISFKNVHLEYYAIWKRNMDHYKIKAKKIRAF